VIQQVESPNEIRSVETVGLGSPLHCGASGRLLLAYLPEEERTAFLEAPLQRYTRLTITDPRRLRQELVRIRHSGSATSYGEASPGACAIAAPIWATRGVVVGCMAVLGPRDRMPGPRLERFRALLLRAVKRTGDELSRTQNGSANVIKRNAS
jgi:DNA-binding IclR family transcriptional regulator